MRVHASWSTSPAPSANAAALGRSFARSRPTKQQVREWLLREVARRAPPPSLDEIQRDLWHAVETAPVLKNGGVT